MSELYVKTKDYKVIISGVMQISLWKCASCGLTNEKPVANRKSIGCNYCGKRQRLTEKEQKRSARALRGNAQYKELT